MANELKLSNPLVVGNFSSDPVTAFNGEIYFNTTSNTFRIYQNAWQTISTGGVTSGNLTDVGTDGIVITGGTNAVLGSGTTIAQTKSDASHNGYLSSTDWSTFNSKGSGTVTSVTFTGDGTVLSSTPSSAVTSSGTVAASLNTQSANTVLAGPTTGSAANPTFRSLVAADIPSLSGTYVPQSAVGAANGVASLDGGGKVPVGQLPSVVMEYQGSWDPTTNTPTLSDLTQYTFTITSASVVAGDTYTNNSQTFTVLYSTVSSVTVVMEGTGAPLASGTLTRASGSGPSTLTFSTFSTGSTAANGNVYWVSALDTGTVPGLSDPSMTNFQIGDLVIYSSSLSKWQLVTPAAGVQSVNGSQGAVTVNAINQLTGDVTTSAASGSQSEASSVAKIQGTTVSGTTGSGNVVFSAAPTLTGLLSGSSASFSSTVTASNISGSTSGTNTGDQTITLTSDVTGTGTGSFATTVAKIAGTTVSGATGTTNVVFSASPTLTGTILATNLTASGTLTTPTLASTGAMAVQANGGSSNISIQSAAVARSTDATNFITETYVNSTTLTDNTSSPTAITAFQYANATYAGEEISYVIKTGTSPVNVRMGTLRIVSNAGSNNTSISDTFSETADCGVTWSASSSGGTTSVLFTTTNQGFNRVVRADIKLFLF